MVIYPLQDLEVRARFLPRLFVGRTDELVVLAVAVPQVVVRGVVAGRVALARLARPDDALAAAAAATFAAAVAATAAVVAAAAASSGASVDGSPAMRLRAASLIVLP